MVGFWKYEFNNKLLGGVTFFRVTLGVTWTQPYISEFDVNFDCANNCDFRIILAS